MTWHNNERLVSQPLRLRWMGWEANTYDLQQHGWELSAQEDVSRRAMSIAIRNQRVGFRGLTDSLDWDYWYQMERNTGRFQDPRSLPCFSCHLGSDIIVNHSGVSANDAVEFRPIDARPMYKEITKMSIDDLAHFRPIEKPKDEIFLREASLDEIMKMALSKQEPRQEQIRREIVMQNEINVMNQSKLRANLRLVA